MRIALVTCHFPPDSIGGGQVQSYRLCQAMGAMNDVAVYTRDYKGNLPRQERIGAVTYSRRKTSHIPFVRSIMDFLKGLQFIKANRNRYDIFLSFHLQLAALMVVTGKLLFGLCVAISPRGKEDFDFSFFPKRMFQKFLYRNASAVLLQSEEVKREFLGRARGAFSNRHFKSLVAKTYIFPNVITSCVTKARTIGDHIPHIVYVGRLVEGKGVRYLIQAIRTLGFSCRLSIVGGGPEHKYLTQLADGLPVSFLGEITFNDVLAVLDTATVLVLPSLTENLPNSVLEALSLGIPVIATRVGALPEIITDGWNGFLVAQRDANAIAERIRDVLQSGSRYEEMSRAALDSISRFTAPVLLPKLQQQLEQITSSHAHATEILAEKT